MSPFLAAGRLLPWLPAASARGSPFALLSLSATLLSSLSCEAECPALRASQLLRSRFVLRRDISYVYGRNGYCKSGRAGRALGTRSRISPVIPLQKLRPTFLSEHINFVENGRKYSVLGAAIAGSSEQLVAIGPADILYSSKCLKESARRLEIPNPQFPTAAYVHLPFCRRRCHYCDFPILPVGENISGAHVTGRMREYVNLLCREISVAASSVSSEYSGGDASTMQRPLETVFFGGGTPSLIPAALLNEVLGCIRENFGVSPDAEISMEMDPGTFNEEKLRAFLDAGVNRVSIGVQAFQDELLKACGRAHGLAEVYDAIQTLQRVGVENWSMDLICSLPGQSLAMWRDSLDKAIASKPKHISIYDLQIEDGTAFGRWYKAGERPLPTDETSAEMFQAASFALSSAGYEHYEISNYAQPGFQCRHNLVYWRNQPYLGFGLGSTSYVNLQRFSRPKKLSEYTDWLAAYELTAGAIEWPKDTPEDRLCDGLMLGLRLKEGLAVDELREAFGEETLLAVLKGLLEHAKVGNVLFLDELGRRVLPENALVESGSPNQNPNPNPNNEVVVSRQVCRIRLSDPEGIMLSNEIISSLFSLLPS